MTETASTPAATGAAPPAAGAQAADPLRWKALFVVLTAAFMVLLDISIVNVAIPSIQNNLDASFSQVQFVLTGYALAYAVFLITGGRLGDTYGRRRLFIIGMAGFTAASALCGLAQSPVMLVVSRVLQGLMASMMYPQVLSVIQVSFPPRERGAAFGIFGATIGLATITGPLLGGLIIRDQTSGNAWRFVFLVNVPVGIVSIVAATRLLRESKAPHSSRLDLPGVAIATAALGLLVYPLVEGRDLGWPAWAFAMMAVSPFVIAGFTLFERRVSRSGGFPLVQLSLFGNRAFTLGLLGSCIFFSGIPSFFFVFSLTLQIGLHFSALHAGLTTLPFALGSALASASSVRLAPRIGKSILHLGAALLVLGMLGTLIVISWRGNALNGLDLAPVLFISGLGLGCFVAPVLNVILAGVPGRDAGSASGVITTMQQVGGAIGVAVIGVIFFGAVGSRAPGAVRDVEAQLRRDLAAAQVPAATADAAVATFDRCFTLRAQAKDLSVTPPGCPAPATGDDAVSRAFVRAAGAALGDDFTGAAERAILYCAAVFGATGLLVTFLPSPAPRGAGRSGSAATGAH